MTRELLPQASGAAIVRAMKDIFIADSHLTDPDDVSYRHLVDFLTSQQGQIRHLVLLGDIFEFWVGYQHCIFSAYLPLLQALQQLERSGTKIVTVEGNHDFHMGPFFSETLKSTIYPDGGGLDLDGLNIYLCHGDTVAATPNYLRLRGFFRSAFAKMLIRILPADTTWKISEILGKMSRGRRASQPKRQYILPEDRIKQYASLRFQEGYNAFICGHFHQAHHQQLDQNQLMVVGNWGTTCHYACYENGQLSLKTYQPAETNH